MLPFARCDPDPPHIKLQEPPDRMGISQELLDNFRRYAEWAAAAYREDNNKEIVSHRDPEMKTWLKCQSEAACEFIDQEHAEITWNTGDHKTHLVAFIAVPKVRQEIIVAFRGTCGIENWFRNFNFHPRRIDWYVRLIIKYCCPRVDLSLRHPVHISSPTCVVAARKSLTASSTRTGATIAGAILGGLRDGGISAMTSQKVLVGCLNK